MYGIGRQAGAVVVFFGQSAQFFQNQLAADLGQGRRMERPRARSAAMEPHTWPGTAAIRGEIRPG